MKNIFLACIICTLFSCSPSNDLDKIYLSGISEFIGHRDINIDGYQDLKINTRTLDFGSVQDILKEKNVEKSEEGTWLKINRSNKISDDLLSNVEMEYAIEASSLHIETRTDLKYYSRGNERLLYLGSIYYNNEHKSYFYTIGISTIIFAIIKVDLNFDAAIVYMGIK